MTVEALRDKYPVFEYKSFSWQKGSDHVFLEWNMTAGNLSFSPKVKIFGPELSNISDEELDNLTFHLGLADIFSCWKATCSPMIKISSGKLDEEQLSWWHDLLVHGMGQYFYENSIDFRPKDFVTIESSGSKMTFPSQELADGILIPVGGGKDSAVTLDLIKKGFPSSKIGAFTMNISKSDKMLPSCKRLMDEAKIKEQIFVWRILDPQIFELTGKGYLNGHIPFSAYMAFLSVFVARLYGYSLVSFSNERSSDESNIDYLGAQINHQYTKSFVFENKFRQYNKKYLSEVNYFSFLRPLYELQIVKIFSKLTNYFPLFLSCNRGYQTDSWCGKCPKCLAVYTGLSAFVAKEELLKIFGHDLFTDASLLLLTKDVLGYGDKKPFECIGTFEETIVAFYLSLSKYKQDDLPVLLKFFKEEILPHYPQIERLKLETLETWNGNNNLPKDFSMILKSAHAHS